MPDSLPLAPAELRAALDAGQHGAVLAALSDLPRLEALCAASLSALLDELAWVLRGAPRPLPAGAHLDHASGARLDRGALLLLEAALQANAEALGQKPGRLFELLYNTLYWHDAPARAAHHDGALPPGGRALWRWMEHWRASFEARPGAAWLRRLRPPREEPLPSWQVGAGRARLSPDGRMLLLGRPVPGYVSNTASDPLAGHTPSAFRLGQRCPPPEGERFLRYLGERAELWSNEGPAPLRELEPHRGPIRRAVFVGGGRLVLTASEREVHALRGADGEGVATWAGEESVEALPCDDGRALLHNSTYGALFWDLPRAVVRTGMTGPIPEGWTAREEKGQLRYRLDTGVYPPSRAFPAELCCLDAGTGAARMTLVSPDGVGGQVAPGGARLLTYSGRHAHLWAADTLAHLRVLGPHPQPIRSAVFSSDGAVVVLASHRELRAFRVEDGSALGTLAVESSDELQPCGEGRVLFHSGKVGWQLWDFLHPPTPAAPPASSTSYAAVSPTGHRLVQYRYGQGLEGWALPSGELMFRQEASGNRLAFSPDGSRFAAATDQGRIELRDATTGAQLGSLPLGDRRALSSLSFDPAGRFLLTCQEGGWSLWELATAQVIARAATGRFYDNHASWSPDGRAFAFGDWRATRVADLTELAPAVRWRDDARPPDRAHPRLHLSPSGATLVVRHGDATGFWDPASGVMRRLVLAKLEAYFAQGRRVLGRRGGALLALSTEDGAELWQAPLPAADFESFHLAEAAGLVLHDDRQGALVALGLDDGRERYRLQGLSLSLLSGEVFLTRSAAGEVALRDVATGAERLSLQVPGGEPRLDLSPDRRWLVVRADPVQVWDLTTRTLRHRLDPGWSGSDVEFRADGALALSTCVSPQSGNTDTCSESVYDLDSGACIGSRSWDEYSYSSPADAPREVAPGVVQQGACLRVGGAELPLPSQALAGGTPRGVIVASTSTGRVELFQLIRSPG